MSSWLRRMTGEPGSNPTSANILKTMRNLSLFLLALSAVLAFSPRSANAQNPADSAAFTEISAEMGPCSALINVTGADSKPLYGAKITTRIQYGLMGVKRLDLEAYTGSNGQVKITHLPEVLKKPMYIHVDKGNLGDEVEFKPNLRCHATFDVRLQ